MILKERKEKNLQIYWAHTTTDYLFDYGYLHRAKGVRSWDYVVLGLLRKTLNILGYWFRISHFYQEIFNIQYNGSILY